MGQHRTSHDGGIDVTVEATQIEAIDVHGHYGHYIQKRHELIDRFLSGDAETVAARARQSNTQWTIVSPLLALLPRGGADAAAGNDEAAEVVPRTPGLLRWVVIDPLNPRTYQQAQRALGEPDCMGIKIHPEEHVYPIREHGRALFEFAARFDAVVLTHSGEANSMPEDFVPFADDFPNVTLILAHLGCTCDGDPSHQVRAIQASRRGNIYVDTSSMQSIMPNLIEWGVAEVGADRVLYGTDTPLYHAPMQRTRIDGAELTLQQKRLILRDNAERLLKLPA